MRKLFSALAGMIVLTVTLTGCTGTGMTSPTTSESAISSPINLPSPTPKPTTLYSEPELKYLLIAKYGELFYTDPDFYPVAREGLEEQNALLQFSAIRENTAEFAAIIKQLGLTDKPDYAISEKVSIYREHKKLSLGIQITPSDGGYNFTLRIGEGQGFRIEGIISMSGVIKETKRESSFNTRPICLARGTLIETPYGQTQVELLQEGATVWTIDSDGKRQTAIILKMKITPMPESFRLVRVTLSDGRSVTASPGHPIKNGLVLGSLSVGELLDGSAITGLEYVNYKSGATFDLLPSGESGLYLANGIPLLSTIER